MQISVLLFINELIKLFMLLWEIIQFIVHISHQMVPGICTGIKLHCKLCLIADFPYTTGIVLSYVYAFL